MSPLALPLSRGGYSPSPLARSNMYGSSPLLSIHAIGAAPSELSSPRDAIATPPPNGISSVSPVASSVSPLAAPPLGRDPLLGMNGRRPKRKDTGAYGALHGAVNGGTGYSPRVPGCSILGTNLVVLNPVIQDSCWSYNM